MATPVRSVARAHGFTLIELLVSTTVMLVVVGATLTTFKQAVDINDTAGQLADSNQNLRAGTNQLVRDLMMAGRIIADGGVPVPNGATAVAINRPGPPGSSLTFSFMADEVGTIVLPSITTGFHLGPTINSSTTDMVTILTVDEFMPVVQGIGSGTPTASQALIAADGSQLTMPVASAWLAGDATNDTPPLQVGDLVLFKNNFGMSIQTVTSVDKTGGHIGFAQNNVDDWFHFNQRSASLAGTVYCVKADTACDTLPVAASVQSAAFPPTALFRLLMITYYVDNTTSPGTPRLTRVINHCPGSDTSATCTLFPAFAPQALAGVVEDVDLTYDLVDSSSDTVVGQTSLPVTVNSIVYTSNMIKTVNVHVGVRSESISKPTSDYVRNHISTAVSVRSLGSVDRYDTSQ